MRTLTALALAVAALFAATAAAHPASSHGAVLAGGFEWTHGGGH